MWRLYAVILGNRRIARAMVSAAQSCHRAGGQPRTAVSSRYTSGLSRAKTTSAASSTVSPGRRASSLAARSSAIERWAM